MLSRPYHIPCHCPPGHSINHAITHKAIPYTMSCQPGHNIYHAISARPNHMPGHTSGHNIYHAMSGLSRHTIHHAMATQVIPYTMPCPPRPYQIPCSGINNARSYHISCHALQAIPYTVPCPQDIPYTMSCPPGHTIYHAYR